MGNPIPTEDKARRDRLEAKGLEFRDRGEPYEIKFMFDIPTRIAHTGFSETCMLMLSRITRAHRRGRILNPSTAPDDRTVRVVLLYHLWDLDSLIGKDEHTADMVFQRIIRILTVREFSERIWVAGAHRCLEPVALQAVTVHLVQSV
ncbi:hypothetical protein P170DRAFT_473369 [Aspergillus steynii IBT 23096]|uniref:Uncharacterized protein n=1 Tax=Aspergillus steynii IBT 23096 TaxID=1392250 RepID=A0A2I2GKV2_9EURO|nr:uncharacterized protein P170DRAFT_473369 [Aspergillus steynii IBT 23096]PLB53508.1 hypothetical protein P170DRAFT_473369 [Aspergillus steynii IBT 23096]